MMTYDVAIIGSGIVGAAIARELAAYDLAICWLEASADVGDGTSKANTAILHTGFDATPGTLESRLVRRGSALLTEYAEEVGIPVERTGAMLVAWTAEELEALPGLAEKAGKNGYLHCSVIGAAQVYEALPALGPGVLGGLRVPDESITCTWTTNLALAGDAVRRGVDLKLSHRVDRVEVGDETVITTPAGSVAARWVINAAGLGSDVIDRLLGHHRFTVVPRRGELLVFDKLSRSLAPCIVLPVPSSKGKGVLISPTIYGNVMLGPTAEDMTDRTATSMSQHGIDFLLERGRKLMPGLLSEEITANYAGVRAAISRNGSDIHGDYLIDIDIDQRYVLVAGIRSTGLTAGMAIAEYVRDLLADQLVLEPRRDVPPTMRMPNIGEAFPRPYERPELIARDPEYGRVICFCERVTAGEIRDALTAVLPARDLGGLRRRTRALNGRCQGFFCGAQVEKMLQEDPA